MNQLLVREMNKTTKKKKKGFTLIELIIVIAIIAILAAVAIPKFGAARHNANVASDQANAKIIATAVASAIADGRTTTDAITSDVYKTYIDGGSVPKSKTSNSGFVVTYDDPANSGIRVTVNGTIMYPADAVANAS